MRIAHTPIYIYTIYTEYSMFILFYGSMVIVIRVYMYENFHCSVYNTIEVDQLLLINKEFLYDYAQFYISLN